MVEVMPVRYVNINARCRASGVLVPFACAVGGINTTQLQMVYSTFNGLPLLQCEAMKGWPAVGNIIGHGTLGCRGMRLMCVVTNTAIIF